MRSPLSIPLSLVAAVLAASGCADLTLRATTTAPAPTATAPTVAAPAPVPSSEWAVGATTQAVANVGSDGNGNTVTRLFVVDTATQANRALRYVPGSWTLPVPVGGAAPEGLSWDGRIAVLADTDGPSRFAVVTLDHEGRAVTIDLRTKGRFLYDALAPDGATLFLTELADAKGAAVDRIVSYNLVSGILDPNPIVDKLDGKEAMVGTSVARVRSANGVSVYTIYDGGTHPFLHALQTDSRITFCVDLPAAGNATAPGTWKVTIDAAGATLTAHSTRLDKSFTIDLSGGVPRVV